MAFDPSLGARIARHLTAQRAPYETKRMMGGLCFMVRGKMCVGLAGDRLMARIGPAGQQAALRRPGCRPMDFTGRPMHGFVFVDAAHLRTERQLAAWLDLALAFNPQATASASRSPRPKTAPRQAAIQPLRPFRENVPRKKVVSTNELAAQLNLGPKSAAWLASAGIRSRADVASLGVIETCRRVRAAGHPASVLLAYALEGALAGSHWNAIPWETKQFLRAEFAKMKRAPRARDLTPRSGATSS